MLCAESPIWLLQPQFEHFEVHVQASLSYQELNHLFVSFGCIYWLDSASSLEDHVSLGGLSPELVIGHWQNHLVEIRVAQVAISIVTVEVHKVHEVIFVKVLLKALLVIWKLQNEIIYVTVGNSLLRLERVPTSDGSKHIVAFKCLFAANFLSEGLDVELSFANKLEYFKDCLEHVLFSFWVVPLSRATWQLNFSFKAFEIACLYCFIQLFTLECETASFGSLEAAVDRTSGSLDAGLPFLRIFHRSLHIIVILILYLWQ